jgi:hypothetical protein
MESGTEKIRSVFADYLPVDLSSPGIQAVSTTRKKTHKEAEIQEGDHSQ